VVYALRLLHLAQTATTSNLIGSPDNNLALEESVRPSLPSQLMLDILFSICSLTACSWYKIFCPERVGYSHALKAMILFVSQHKVESGFESTKIIYFWNVDQNEPLVTVMSAISYYCFIVHHQSARFKRIEHNWLFTQLLLVIQLM